MLSRWRHQVRSSLRSLDLTEAKYGNPVDAYISPVTLHTVEADGVNIFYRDPARPMLRYCYCCMATRLRRTCSAICSPDWPLVTD